MVSTQKIVFHHPFLLLIAFGIAAFSNTLFFTIAPVLLLIIFLISDKTVSHSSLINPYSFLLLAFLYLFLFQFVVTADIEFYQWKGIYRLFIYFLLYFFISTLRTESIHVFLKALTWIICLATPVGIYIFLSGERYSFIFPHANHLAYVIILLLFYNIVVKKDVSLFLISLLAFNLSLSKSSGGMITFFVLIAFTSFSLLKKVDSKRKLLVMSLALIVVPLLPAAAQKLIYDIDILINFDFSEISWRGKNLIFGGSGSAVWRMSYWYAILDAFFHENIAVIMVGNGLDAMTKDNYIFDFMYTDPHSDFVKIIIEGGVIGLFFFFLFLRYIIRTTRKRILLIVIVLPMLWGNILVNLPYNVLLIAIIILLHRLDHTTQNIQHIR